MIKFGNHKLGEDTAIFNMTSAKNCPSRKLGLCEVINNGNKCYAQKPEEQYPTVVPNARNKQEEWWKNNTKEELLRQIKDKIKRRRTETRYLRFNESGDFGSQEDVSKLSFIADGLKEDNIVTYGYTARDDLDYSKVGFLVKTSGINKKPGNVGKTIVVNKLGDVPKDFIPCPNHCRYCTLCKCNQPFNIAFVKH